jgi:hypothetical protein
MVRVTEVRPSIAEWIMQYGVAWHLVGLGHNPFHGRGPGTGLEGEPSDHKAQQQFPVRPHPGVPSAARLVKALKGPEESRNRVRRARKGMPSEGGEPVPQPLPRVRDPGIQPTRLRARFGRAARAASSPGARITGLDHPRHVPFEPRHDVRGPTRGLRSKPPGDALLGLNAAHPRGRGRTPPRPLAASPAQRG